VAGHYGDAHGSETRRRKAFFSEEKKQKTFTSLGARPVPTYAPKKQKFFGSFFQKRTSLPVFFGVTR
jgi:hypothetical protein